MKNIFYILLLLPCLAMAQYQGNGNQKITLGEQTTADGLVFRGVANDTNVITPFSDTSAYIILDTVNSKFYHYNRTTTYWALAGGGVSVTSFSAGTTGFTPSTATTGAVTLGGTLAVANGGTGQTTLAAAGIITSNTGVPGYYPRFSTATNIIPGLIYDNGSVVGVNTTTPAAFLQVKTATNQNVGYFAGTSGSTISSFNDAVNANVDLGFDANKFMFRISGVEKMQIATSGNVGIGTASPTARLHVKGSGVDGTTTALKVDNLSGTNLLTVLDNGDVTLKNPLAVVNGGTGQTTLSPNNYLIRTNSSGVFDTSAIFEANGNVGINTNNPLANLVLFNPTGTSTRFVAGNTNSATALYSTYLGQKWSIFELYKDGLGSTGTTAFVGGINDALPTSSSATLAFIGYNKAVGTPGVNDLRTHIIVCGLDSVNSGNFQFYTMNSGTISEKLRISASGNVGIGTTSPAVQFHTTGAVRFATFAGGGTTTLSVDNTGNLARTSSIELKKDVTPISYGLNEILQINPINFNWIDEDKFGNENENGFIAEDVMSVIPNVVAADTHGLFMDYTKLIPILTKAIQEQQALIKALEQRIINLENK